MIAASLERESPRRRLQQMIAEAWRPRPRLSTPEWVSANVRLPGEFGTPGRYDLDDYPYFREILASADDVDVEVIALMFATQVGKTTMVQALMQALSDLEPAPMMFVGPDKDFVHEIRDKIYAACRLNPTLRRRIPPAHKWNLRWLDFGKCYCYLAWVRNTQRVSGKAVKNVFCSEVDRYDQPAGEGAIYKLISERVKSFTRFRIIYESTPTDETSAIADIYESTDKRTYHVPCPHCGHYQELRFFPHKGGPQKGLGGVAGLQDERGEWLNPDQALTNAYYLCEKGCRIESEEKQGMVSRGVWCPDGCVVTKKGKLLGQPKRSGRRRGYQLGSIYSKVISFGRIAAEYLDARENESSLRNFVNNWLGIRYTIRSKTPKWRTLGRRLEAGYRRGTAPPSALFLTCGSDVQGDRVYWVVRGWGEGCTSWLVDRGCCPQRIDANGSVVPESDLAQLDPLLAMRFPLSSPNPLGATSLPIRLLGADVNFEGHRVWEWVRKHPGDRVRAVAGDQSMKADFYQMTVVEKSVRDGKPYPGGLERWGIATAFYKSDIQKRWQYPVGDQGVWLLPHGVLDDSETYLRQITNETSYSARNRDGHPVTGWRVIDHRVGNHYWDCEVYARALADMVVGGVWEDLVKRMTPAAAGRRKTQTADDEFAAR